MGDMLVESEFEEEFHAILQTVKSEISKMAWQNESEEDSECEDFESLIFSNDDDDLYDEQKYSSQTEQESQAEIANNESQIMSYLCRFCASHKRNMIHLFKEYENIVGKIGYCLPIMVKTDDALPKQACRQCLDKLESCYQFFKDAKEAENQLTQLSEEIEGKCKNKEGDHSTNSKTMPSHKPLCVARKRTSNKTQREIPCRLKGDATRRRTGNPSSTHHRTSSTHNRTIDPCEIWGQQIENVSRLSVYDIRPCTVRLEKCILKAPENIPDIKLHPLPITSNQKSSIASNCFNEIQHHEKPSDSTDSKDWLSEIEITVQKQGETCDCKAGKRRSCAYCGKLFPTRSRLREHERTHTGEKPFACNFCPKKFITRSRRKLHLRIHTGELFECSMCEKKWKTASDAKRHMITHSQAKPYNCSMCNISFKRQESLSYHAKNKHKVK